MSEVKGRQFKQLRREAGLKTRRQAAEFLGVAEHTIYRWETDRSGVPEYAPRMVELLTKLRSQESTMSETRRRSAHGVHGLMRAAFREMRERQGLKQDTLSRRAHVSRSWLVHFERHSSVPSASLLAAALVALNFEVTSALADVPVLGKTLAKLDGDACRQVLALLLAAGLVNAPAALSAGRPPARTTRSGDDQQRLFDSE